MDTSQIFNGAETQEIEGYKLYMYKAFASDVTRFMSKRLIASIKYEIHPETDSIDISINHGMKKEGFAVTGESRFECSITDVLACIKAEAAWQIAMDICNDYKDAVWHCFFKERPNKKKDADVAIEEVSE